MIKSMKKNKLLREKLSKKNEERCFYVSYRFNTLLLINQDMFASYIVVFRKIIITDAGIIN
jgi:hypothetical protein